MVSTARASPRPLTGRLGRYELLGRIAIGGMAELYLARSEGIEGFEKVVVLKRFLPSKAVNSEFVKMFLHEARLAATLHHPNVVQVYDIGEADGTYFFTMEYIHGRDLRELAKVARDNRIALPLNHIMKVMIGVAGGLHYAHEKRGQRGEFLNLVHRDISPSNVIVTFAGGIKLVDFGIAKATTAEVHTSVGTLKGKIPYMSPEQCRGEKLDRRSDIFSLGVLLWEFTTARRLWTGGHELILIERIAREEAPRPSSIVPNYPPALERIVMKALSKRREDRYSSAEELQIELEDFSHEHHLPLSSARLGRFLQEVFPEDDSSQIYRLDPSQTPGFTPPAPTRATAPVPTPHHARPRQGTDVLSEEPRMSRAPTVNRQAPKFKRQPTGPHGFSQPRGASTLPQPGPRRTIPQGSVSVDDYPPARSGATVPQPKLQSGSYPALHTQAPQGSSAEMTWGRPRTDVLPHQSTGLAGTDVLQGRMRTGTDLLADVTATSTLEDTDQRGAGYYPPPASGPYQSVHETTSFKRASAVGFLVFAIIAFLAVITAVGTLLYYRNKDATAEDAPVKETQVIEAEPVPAEFDEPPVAATTAVADPPPDGEGADPAPAGELELDSDPVGEPDSGEGTDAQADPPAAVPPKKPKGGGKKKKKKKKKKPVDLDSPLPPG